MKTINYLLGGALFLALTGCNKSNDHTATGSATPSTAGTGALSNGKLAAPKSTGAPHGAAPVKIKDKPTSLVKAPVKMTMSQAMGVDILKALNASPAMKGHTISVGTTNDTVILNGKVKTAVQKKTAETIARKKAPKAKVTNKIELSAQ